MASPERRGAARAAPAVLVGGLATLLGLLATVLLAGDARDRLGADSAVRAATRSGPLDDLDGVAAALGVLGGFPVVLLVLLGGAALLHRAGRPRRAVVLVLGFLVGYGLMQATKGLVDRPRPGDRLATPLGSAFPSGHATSAVAWAALGAALGDLVPGRRGRALLAAGVLLAVLVGLSRVVLRVHWLSDVVAGWGLGAAAYAGVAWWLLRPRLRAPSA